MGHIQALCNSIPLDFGDSNAVNTNRLTGDKANYQSIVKALISFLEHTDMLQHTCLAFIELKLIEKYLKQNILKEDMVDVLLHFGTICMLYAMHVSERENILRFDVEISLKCADLILKQKLLWNVINSSDGFTKHLDLFVDVLYRMINVHFGSTTLMSKFDVASLAIYETNDCDRKAIFLAKFVELRRKNERNDYFKLEVTDNRDTAMLFDFIFRFIVEGRDNQPYRIGDAYE